jgi:hypothetical protein
MKEPTNEIPRKYRNNEIKKKENLKTSVEVEHINEYTNIKKNS